MQQPVEVTLKFGSYDEAILALGKLAVAATTPRASGPAPIKPQAEAATVTKTRKPRADAGKVRGPYKDSAPEAQKEPAAPDAVEPPAAVPAPAAVAAPVAAEPKAAAVSPAPADPAPTPVLPAAAPKVTEEDAQKALQRLWDTKGPAVAIAVLAAFHASKIKQLKAEDYPAFVAKANAVAEGAEV